jgi:hypothetical protein
MKPNQLLTLSLAIFTLCSYAAPPISIYDGSWVGRAYCGENILPNANPKYTNSFSHKITFNVFNGEAVASIENAEHINNYKLKINSGGTVSIDQRGNYKNNFNIAWLVETVGNVRVGFISTQGLMTFPDKSRIIRNGCGFELSNNEVIGRLASHQEEELRKQVKSTVTAQPSKSSKSESVATVNAENPRAATPSKSVAAKDAAPARSTATGKAEEPKSPKSNSKPSSHPFD